MEQQVVYWVEDGHCARFSQALEGRCGVGGDFGSWVQECDPMVHACCTFNFDTCWPDELYQP